MKINSTYNIADRKMAVVLVVMIFIISSFFATGVEPQPVNQRVLPETTQLSHSDLNEAHAIIKQDRASRSIRLLVRGKAKVKGFYKQYFSGVSAVGFSLFRQYLVPLTTSFTTTVSRPDYYNFLFRLTPF